MDSLTYLLARLPLETTSERELDRFVNNEVRKARAVVSMTKQDAEGTKRSA